MAAAQIALRFLHGRGDIDTWATVDKALALDPNLSEAHAARSSHLRVEGRLEEALTEANLALGLDPQSHEANIAAANAYFSLGRFAEAVPHFDKTTAHTETEYYGAGLLITCHTALGDRDGATRAARICLEHARAALAKDSANGAALGFGATALAVLGEADRSREWVRRALLMDPDNMYMRYNLACALSAHLGDVEGALDLLGPFFQEAATHDEVAHAKVDPDLDPVRGDARFQTMLSAADARLAAGDQAS
jgi:adenylate cyclase